MFLEKGYGSIPGYLVLFFIIAKCRIVMEAVTSFFIGIHHKIFVIDLKFPETAIIDCLTVVIDALPFQYAVFGTVQLRIRNI